MNRWVRIAIVPLMGLAAYAFLSFLQFQLKLGDYAKSPERLTLVRQERKVVAGGRAGLELVGARYGKAKLILRCLEDGEAKQREISLEEGGFSRDRCAVTIHLLKIHGEDGVRADFEVSWEP